MRSGNTLLRLILNHIFNERNITSSYIYRFFATKCKTIIPIVGPKGEQHILHSPSPDLHAYEDILKDNYLIITWRDPRDSIISWIRTEYSKQNTDKFPTLEYILENCERTAKEQREAFKGIIKMHNQHPKNNILELKYENYHNNFDFLFDKLEKFFKIKIDSSTKEYINEEFSKKSVIEFQKNIGPNFNHFCDISNVHGEHVYKGDNKWKEVLTPEILDIINPILDPYIKKWESIK